MKKINSYMTKAGLVQGDELKIYGYQYIVNCDGYLVRYVGNIGVVDIETTANVIFGNTKYEYTNVSKITRNDYSVLQMLDRMGFKNVMYSGTNLYASKFDMAKLNKAQEKDGGIDLSKATNIFATNDIVHIVPFLAKDEETRFTEELCYDQFYSVKFLLKRYKNRVLEETE